MKEEDIQKIVRMGQGRWTGSTMCGDLEGPAVKGHPLSVSEMTPDMFGERRGSVVNVREDGLEV